MEETFDEQIVPGTFIRVLSEGLIAPSGVSFGNVGIVGTAAAAAGVTNAFSTTHVLGNMEEAAAIFAPADAGSLATLNLMRALPLLFNNGARTVYARAVAAASNQAAFEAALRQLVTSDVNIIIAPELATDTGIAVLKVVVDAAENDARDVLAVVGSDGADADAAVADALLSSNKRLVLATPAVRAFDPLPAPGAAGAVVTLPGQYTAAAVAGLIASLAPQSSPTNKVLSGVTELGRQFSYGDIKKLVKGRACVLESRQGVRVVRGVTTDNGGFTQITTRRIVDFAKAGIRQVASPFVGRLNNDRVRKALRGAIDSFLTTMVVDEALTGYELEVVATRADEIAGRCVVNVALQPTFSIDYIRVTLNLS